MNNKHKKLTDNIRKHQQRDAEFVDYVNFVEEKTTLVTDPMFSRAAFDSFMDKAQKSSHKSRGVRTYATKTDITREEGKS